ncbi:MAG: hypothetical protein L0220_10410 [Acidobacteria bacterium]|nr:hypothetical protein [Acidobacteriota bacterium]
MVIFRQKKIDDQSARLLLTIVSSGIHDSEKSIEKLFDWHFHYTLFSVRLFVGSGLAILASLLIIFYKGELDNQAFLSTVAFIGGILTVAAGLYRYTLLRQIPFEYIQALHLLKNAAPLIKRFQDRER